MNLPPLGRAALFVALLTGAAALADTWRENLSDAEDDLTIARERSERYGGRCRDALYDPLRRTLDDIDDVRRAPRHSRLSDLRRSSSALASAAAQAGCPNSIARKIRHAIDAMEEARQILADNRRDRSRDDDEERWSRHHRRDDDRRDDRDDRDEPGRGQARITGAPTQVTLGALRVLPPIDYQGDRATRIDVPELSIQGLNGQPFYIGARFRAANGDWCPWSTTNEMRAPSDPFVWRGVHQQMFTYGALRPYNTANGRFVAQVAVFGPGAAQLDTKEIPFEVSLPAAPPPHGRIIESGPPAPPPPGNPGAPPPPGMPSGPPPPVRNCGTAADPGCGLARGGHYAMEAPVYGGILNALRNNRNELTRKDQLLSMANNNWFTAMQLGEVLDLFPNEIIRLDVARALLPRTVNPQHAYGFAVKWRNSQLAADYTKLVGAQR